MLLHLAVVQKIERICILNSEDRYLPLPLYSLVKVTDCTKYYKSTAVERQISSYGFKILLKIRTGGVAHERPVSVGVIQVILELNSPV